MKKSVSGRKQKRERERDRKNEREARRNRTSRSLLTPTGNEAGRHGPASAT